MTEIRLIRGETCIVDAVDYGRLASHAWHLNNGYAARHCRDSSGRLVKVYMHREILGLGAGELADHIDGDRLNNRRVNLRRATSSLNSQNRSGFGASGYKGVYKHSKNGNWFAAIWSNGRQRHLGCFDTPEQAAGAYNKAALAERGPKARINMLRDGTI